MEYLDSFMCIIVFIIFLSILIENPVFGITEVSVGNLPFDVSTNSMISRTYTVDLTDNTVSVIDGVSGSPTENTVIATIPIGSNPTGITVNPITNRVYSTDQGSNTVTVIDGTPGSITENMVIATIPVGSGPVSVAIDTTNSRAYVGNIFDGTVSVIDILPGSMTENDVIDTIVVGGVAQRVAVDENLNKVYVTNPFSNTVFVIDTITNIFTDTITVGLSPVGIVIDPASNRVYTADSDSDSVTIIDGITNAVIDTIPVPNNPNGIAFDPNNNQAYVTNSQSDTLTVIDTTTNSVVGTILVGQGPGGVSFDQSTDRIYVANRQSNSVSIIDALGSNPPVAIAGEDQVVDEGTLVTLEGVGLGFGTLTFSWDQIAGPPVMLSDPSILNPTFIVPEVGSTTVLTFELTVNDGMMNSTPDSVNVVVRDISSFTVPLVQTSSGFEGDVDVGDLNAGAKIILEYQIPPGGLPSSQLDQTELGTGVNGNDISFDFLLNSNVPTSLPQPPIETALFFDIEFNGIDFSDPNSFLSGQTPKTQFTVNKDFTSASRFDDDCPVIPFFLLNEVSNQWEQLGDPILPNTNKIFVANAGESTVSIIDGTTNQIEETILVPGGVHEVSFDQTSNFLYVSNPLSSSVSVIDLTTNMIIKTIPVGIAPVEVDVDTINNRAYVANRGSDSISVIDTITNTVVATIPVGSTPIQVEVDPGTNRVYVTNFFSNSVSVIDGSTNSVIATVPVGFFASGVDVDHVTNTIYSTNFGSNSVSVIDGKPGSATENTVIDTISVGVSPATLVVDPSSNKIFVANTVSDDVSVIDRSANVVIDTIPAGDGPILVNVNPNTNRIFVNNQNSDDITIIDGSTNTAIDTIDVGLGPIGLALNSNVPNPVRDPSTDVIDFATGEILQCSYIGDQPHLSKFAIGGIRALALGALVGGGSSLSSGGSAPSMDNISFDGTSTINEDGTIEFGGVIVDEIGPVNNLPLQTVMAGEPFELRFPFYEDNGINALQHVAVYFLQEGEETVSDSQTSIIFEPNRPVEFSDTNDLISNVTAKSIVKSAYNIDVIFGMVFNSPIDEPLDVIVRSWDKYRRSSDIMFNDLLLIEPNTKISFPTDTSTELVPGWDKSIQSSLTKSTTVFKETYEGSQITFDLENGQSVTKLSAIPIWVKNNAYWWSEEKIDDNDFVAGIQHLIDQNIMTVPKRHVISILETPPPIEIPEWVKNNASWWSKGEISDDEFIQSIQWLIEEGIMTV